MTRIVIADDHTLVRQSLVKLVHAESDFEVVGEAERGGAVCETVQRLRPELLVLDINMPDVDGIQVATQLRRLLPEVRILFLTMRDDDATIRRVLALGADGYVPKVASTDELLQAIRAVAKGGTYLSPVIARRVMDMAGGRSVSPAGQLTQRELEILRLIAAGSRPADVAEKVFLSLKTVKNHLTSVYAKLGVQTAAQAVAEAYRLGIVSPEGN